MLINKKKKFVKKIQISSCPEAFPNSSWCLASPLWLLLGTERFQAPHSQPVLLLALHCLSPRTLCVALSPAPPMAWAVGVGGKDLGAWEGGGCPAVAALRGSAGAGQEQGTAPLAQEVWDLHLWVSGLPPPPRGVPLRPHQRGEPDKP